MSMLSSLLFPVPPPSYTMHSFDRELMWIPWGLDYGSCKTGDCFPAIFLQCPNARYLVLYFHANGEDIGLCYPFGHGLRSVLEVHVLLVEYPGYGIGTGKCSEDTLWRTATTAFRFISEVLQWPAEDIIIMGRSLGTALAVRLASTCVCHGLILVAPFLSLVDAIAQHTGGLARMLIGNIFSNKDRVGDVRVPLLVIHGKKDRLVPCKQGQQLFDLCPHDRKLLVCPDDMGHNCDLLGDAEFLIRPMLRLFALPDYNFDDLVVPEEAFNKRFCHQYHGIVEQTRGDVPLMRACGDEDPCLFDPHSVDRDSPRADGSTDECEGSKVASTSTAATRCSETPRNSPRCSGPRWRTSSMLEASGDQSVPASSNDSPCNFGVPDSATRLSASESNSDEDGFSLPGLDNLDIDNAITCFLHESAAAGK